MKKHNRIIGITLILCMFIAMVCPFANVYATTGNASIKASNNTIYVGESTKITASVSNSEVWNLAVTSTGGSLSGTTQDADAPGSEVSKQVISCNFTASSAGTYTITLSGTVASTEDVNNQKIQTVSKTVKITVKDKEEAPVTPPSDNNQDIPKETNPGTGTTTTKSSNNYLSSLKVSEGTLSPEFSFRTYKYSVNVGEEVNSIKVTAKAEHNKATVSGTGTKTLKPGENKIDVTVKAEDGKERTYTITVNKAQKEEVKVGLKSLLIKGVTQEGEEIELSYAPEFFSEIYEYQMLLDETLSNVTKLNVEAFGLQDDFIIEIAGNEDLKEGENTITITVKSKDGNTTVTYTIVVIKEAKTEIISATVEAEENVKPIWNTTQKILITIFTSIIAIMGIVFAVIEYRYQKEHKGENEEKEQKEELEVPYSGIQIDNQKRKEETSGEVPFAKIGFENETDKVDILNDESETKSQEIKNQSDNEEELKKQAKSKKGKHF